MEKCKCPFRLAADRLTLIAIFLLSIPTGRYMATS